MRGRRCGANNGLKSLSTREIIAWSLLWRYCESFNSFWGVKYELYGFQQLTPITHLWTECGVALENYKTHAHARRVCRHTHTRDERPSWHSRLAGFINDKPQLFTQHILFQTKERVSEREREGEKLLNPIIIILEVLVYILSLLAKTNIHELQIGFDCIHSRKLLFVCLRGSSDLQIKRLFS